ncbi:hypothetical protein [Saccharibacillus sp. JS10]|uniref:hypothetical protein n=1 Tax=Saccharibacillus sp. JS10 TaxID=2950552 RepID=UPI00210A814D|nr:hypothetical protein [Saccharibacillus sp. JS10]MCQ4087592.1 hypothetical protein [Saccharibacillus sp. JS10]
MDIISMVLVSVFGFIFVWKSLKVINNAAPKADVFLASLSFSIILLVFITAVFLLNG